MLPSRWWRFLEPMIGAVLIGAVACQPGSHGDRSEAPDGEPARHVRTVLRQALPPVEGQGLTLDLLEVTYAPGASSPPHTHSCPVVGYVLRGKVRVQLGEGPEIAYTAGESFYEPPHSAHLVSANASEREPAAFLAVFACSGGEANDVAG